MNNIFVILFFTDKCAADRSNAVEKKDDEPFRIEDCAIIYEVDVEDLPNL